MSEPDLLRSIQGYPREFEAPIPYEGIDLLIDGDLVFEDGDIMTVEGAAGVGQSLALGLGACFADLSDPEGIADRTGIWSPPRPDMSLPQRIDAAISDAAPYLKSVLDVRWNGHDIEIDFWPFGYEIHVLRLDNLNPRDGATCKIRRALPICRRALLEVEDLSHRLLSHAKSNPELLRQIHWRTFERMIAELLEKAGWRVLELTQGSKDGGVDIYAARPGRNGSTLAVIDCKKYGPKIGVGMVRSIAGLKLQHQADVGVLVTTSYFTSGARNLEQKELRGHVELYDFDRVKDWLKIHEWKGASGLFLPKPRFSADAVG